MPAVSIIMPVYNVEKYVKKAVESVLMQTYEDYELIVVNDGTQDDSMNIVKKLALEDERLRIINQENRGLSAARNTGLKAARGEYVYFVDSDDIVSNRLLEITMTTIFEKHPDVLMFGMVIEKIGNNENIINVSTLKVPRTEYSRHNMNEFIINDNTMELIGYSTNKLYRRETVVAHNILFDEKIVLLEDIDFNEKVFKVINTFIMIDDCLYYYKRRNHLSLISTFQLKHFDWQLEAIRSRQEIFENWKVEEDKIESSVAKLHMLAIRRSCSNLFRNINELSFKEKLALIDLMLGNPLTLNRIQRFETPTLYDKFIKAIIERKRSFTLAVISYFYFFYSKCVIYVREQREDYGYRFIKSGSQNRQKKENYNESRSEY